MSKQQPFDLDKILRNAERRYSRAQSKIRRYSQDANPNQNAPADTYLDAHMNFAITRSILDAIPQVNDYLALPPASRKEKVRSRIAFAAFLALVLGGVYLLVSEPGVASTDPEYAKKKKTRNIGGWVVLILGFSVLFA
jgi:hypothetical protein